MVTKWIPTNVILEIFIPMFGKRDSKNIPSNILFRGNLYTRAHRHFIPKEGRLE
jgi:hypothetical protein